MAPVCGARRDTEHGEALACRLLQDKLSWIRWPVIRFCGQRTQARRQRRRHPHAYANPIRIFELDDGFTMIIGANRAAIIYEVGVIDGVHAMRAREKFLR